MIDRRAIGGVILAGGKATRMGGAEKCLLEIGGKPILARVLGTLSPQVGPLAISANGDPDRFGGFGLPVVADGFPEHAGPLAGMLAGMDWLRAEHRDCHWLITVPGDLPFPPDDLTARLAAAAGSDEQLAAVARSGGRTHPVVGLWPVALADPLRAALEGGLRRAGGWAEGCGAAEVDWPTTPVDPFFNVNTPEDLDAARRGYDRANGV